METSSIEANGVAFTLLTDGPGDGPLALCLHGFPDTAWTWRHLVPELAGAGYRAVACNMRGFAPTSVPTDGRYQGAALARDANALHEALGGTESAVLIGHDWGAMATLGAAVLQPARWSRLVTMAVPPASALASGFLGFRQLRRSWYMFFFQSALAEVAVPADDFAFIDGLWAEWSPGLSSSASAEDRARVKEALVGDHLAAALGYYRALFDPTRHDPELAADQAALAGTAPQPSLYLHGVDDGCLGVELAAPSLVLEGLAPGSRAEHVAGAGHFLHLERPAEVNRLVLEFLQQ
jgi:pimeloyl-ACP methyl ester carboxylesterase